ncbi:glucose dehydrogenase 2, type B [Haloferax elongans ATCC BAA-1513]|uniref:Glucose dehydrogenase 2, type B n=1 Tax=Haloferax elongans ATCC BAA-1513 TaxID=1230453 RepID=M0HSL8_HALEO|nr:PQQ-dependent sugar dehydrogenase [Haloferax elongans]ELZ87476.1 glucose dehydrogenase 2, type B [Haloferax elongans ATCC BAA-1513]
MSRLFSRRSLLATLGIGSLAGCLRGDSSTGSTTDTPTPTTEQTTATTTATATPVPPVTERYDLSVDHESAASETAWEPPSSPPPTKLNVEPVVENIAIPWEVTFAPNGDLFVSERPGRILRYNAGALEASFEAKDVVDASAVAHGEEGGWWAAGGEGGLMGLAVHPRYPTVPVVYAVYTYDAEGGPRNRLVCFDVTADDPAKTETVLIDGIPGANVHNGSRIAFGPANYLWMTTGDAAEVANAADPTNLAGAVLRLEPDGTAPSGNSDFGSDSDPRLYTIGHRNPQGLTWLPDGTPLVTEHGPGGKDEINRLIAGGNYGWGTMEPTNRNAKGYTDSSFARPVVNTGSKTWAPPGCAFYTGSFDGFQNRLVVGGLRSQRLNVVTLVPSGDDLPGADSGTVFDAPWMDAEYDAVAHARLENEVGRIRDVTQAPDGSLLISTSNRDGRTRSDEVDYPRPNDDRILRVVPASE